MSDGEYHTQIAGQSVAIALVRIMLCKSKSPPVVDAFLSLVTLGSLTETSPVTSGMFPDRRNPGAPLHRVRTDCQAPERAAAKLSLDIAVERGVAPALVSNRAQVRSQRSPRPWTSSNRP